MVNATGNILSLERLLRVTSREENKIVFITLVPPFPLTLMLMGQPGDAQTFCETKYKNNFHYEICPSMVK